MRGGYPAVIDRYEDVNARLDRQLLAREEPQSHATARRQLEAAKVAVWPGPRGIVAVFSEAIVYRDPKGRVMTAWSDVQQQGSKIVFLCEEGMPAFSPAEREML